MIEQELVLVECEALGDWWTIELAEHKERSWVEEIENTFHCRWSGRISDADVEGTSAEMLGIAWAIEDRGEYSAKRCAVDATGDTVLFESPRNSHTPAEVSLSYAVKLAEEIRRKLKDYDEG